MNILFFGSVNGSMGLFPVIFFTVFAVIVISMIINTSKKTLEWQSNNVAEVQVVDGQVVTKRSDVSHYNSGNGHHNSSTTYYVTFQYNNGDRVELKVKSSDYGMLVEKDIGVLKFQGTRYLSFERNITK